LKVRIKGNSIRYRLTKSEVNQFCSNGLITDSVNFGGNILTYSLAAYADDSMIACFENKNITIKVPENYRKEWLQAHKISFQNDMILGDGNILNILIEKDFVCLDERDEDESDNYPNPKANN